MVRLGPLEQGHLEGLAGTVAVNRLSGAQAFLPSVLVNADGDVGVLYFDFRNDTLGDAVLSRDIHLALFDASLTPVRDERVTTSSFDLRQSVITGARGYFPGDYVDLDVDGKDFVAAVTVTNQLGLPVQYPQVIPGGLAVDNANRQDDRGDIDAATDAALALYKEIAPSSALEALLVTQMAATHNVALEMLRRTMVRDQTSEATDRNVNRATKLMRTFTAQVEALERLRGKTSQQKVTVEHVHVHEGGQAVVGNVTGGGAGDGRGK